MMKRRTTALTQCFDVKEIMSFFSTCFDNSIFNLGNPESYSFWAFIYTEKGDLTFKIGGVDGCNCAEILSLIEQGKIDTTPLITHRYKLENIEEAYHLFENKLDGVIKVAVMP